MFWTRTYVVLHHLLKMPALTQMGSHCWNPLAFLGLHIFVCVDGMGGVVLDDIGHQSLRLWLEAVVLVVSVWFFLKAVWYIAKSLWSHKLVDAAAFDSVAWSQSAAEVELKALLELSTRCIEEKKNWNWILFFFFSCSFCFSCCVLIMQS